jgi:hypothetical protein
MNELEVIRKVNCPQEDKELEIENECCFCNYYDGEDRIMGSDYVKCNYVTRE